MESELSQESPRATILKPPPTLPSRQSLAQWAADMLHCELCPVDSTPVHCSLTVLLSQQWRPAELYCVACTTIHCTTVPCINLHFLFVHFTTIHCTTVTCRTVYCTIVPCTTVHCIPVPCTTLQCTNVPCTTLQLY